MNHILNSFKRLSTNITSPQLNVPICVHDIIIIIIEFFASQLWLGNIPLSWDVVINRIKLDGLICSLNFLTIDHVSRITDFCSFVYVLGCKLSLEVLLDFVIVTLELLPYLILLSGSLVLPFAST